MEGHSFASSREPYHRAGRAGKRAIYLSICLACIVTLISCVTATTPPSPTELPATATESPTATAVVVVANPTVQAPTSTPAIAGPTSAPPVSPRAQPSIGAKTEALPSAILAKAASTRGLGVKGEVPFSTISRDELRPYLVQMFEKEHARKDLEKQKALWVMLDLIDERDDLYGLWLDLLGEQVIGFYEFDSRSMKLVGSGGTLSKTDELTLVHEYVHALQDQHFSVGPRIKQVRNDSEKALALRSLVEGDATIAMLHYALENMSREDLAAVQNDAGSFDTQKLRSAPLPLLVSVLFPYQQGGNFTHSLYHSGGWAAVDKAYANPPITSEQIIHPEKYIAGEGPKQVDIPDIAPSFGDQWSHLDSNTMGELGWLVYFANGLDPEQAAAAAAGWGGDEYALFQSATGERGLAALSTWDTEDDAEEFFIALYDLQDTHVETSYTLEKDTRFAWDRASTSGYVSIKGQQVLLVITTDEDTTSRIVERFNGF